MEYIEIIVKLRRIIRSINLESKQIEKRFGISIPQLLVLQFLSQQEDYKASSTRIKEYLNLNASTITGIISRLEGKGLVARLPKPNDRRVALITLTAKGAELLKESPTILQQKLTKKLAKLSDKEITELNKNIDILVEIMNIGDVDASPVLTINEISIK